MSRTSVYFPPSIHEAASIRAEKAGYSSFSDYIAGLVRADVCGQVDHGLSLRMRAVGVSQLHKLDEAILREAKVATCVEYELVAIPPSKPAKIA